MIEQCVLEVAIKNQGEVDCTKSGQAELSDRAKDLIKKRKETRRLNDKKSEVEASKQLRKEMRAIMHASGVEKIRRILSEFRGLRNIADIRANGKKCLLTSVLDLEGKLHTSRQGIVDAFAAFYELLYSDSMLDAGADILTDIRLGPDIDEVRIEGIREQLHSMKNGKSKDEAGTVVEM